MNLTIREASITDIEATLPLLEQLVGETGFDTSFLYDLSLTEKGSQQFIEKYAASSNSLFLVAERDTQIVGILICSGSEDLESQHKVTLAFSIDKEWQKRKVKSELVNYALEWAKKSGLARIELAISSKNKADIQFLENNGFKIEAVRKKSIYQNGKYVDDMVMAMVF